MNDNQNFNFPEKETQQIISLVKAWASGSWTPIDARKYSKVVIRWAEQNHLIEKRCRHQIKNNWTAVIPCIHCGSIEKGARWFAGADGWFNPNLLPVKILWKLVDPIIGESTGWSTARNRGWLELNIYPANSRYHTLRDLTAMEQILYRLDQFHYIRFYQAGSVWNIYRMDPAEYLEG